jgi:hypothetical protein
MARHDAAPLCVCGDSIADHGMKKPIGCRVHDCGCMAYRTWLPRWLKRDPLRIVARRAAS